MLLDPVLGGLRPPVEVGRSGHGLGHRALQPCRLGVEMDRLHHLALDLLGGVRGWPPQR